eukprot:scpid88767/ scgid35420/ 
MHYCEKDLMPVSSARATGFVVRACVCRVCVCVCVCHVPVTLTSVYLPNYWSIQDTGMHYCEKDLMPVSSARATGFVVRACVCRVCVCVCVCHVPVTLTSVYLPNYWSIQDTGMHHCEKEEAGPAVIVK